MFQLLDLLVCLWEFHSWCLLSHLWNGNNKSSNSWVTSSSEECIMGHSPIMCLYSTKHNGDTVASWGVTVMQVRIMRGVWICNYSKGLYGTCCSVKSEQQHDRHQEPGVNILGGGLKLSQNSCNTFKQKTYPKTHSQKCFSSHSPANYFLKKENNMAVLVTAQI